MIKLQDGQISQILPEYLSERDAVKALSFAIRQAVRQLIGYCQNISVFAVLDTAPEYILDLLALELNTQYYDDALEAGVKRRLIKNTLIWYISAGTPKAVEELVSSVFGTGEVREWYEYGDEPYYFKIITDALLTSDTFEYFSLMIERVKNARSHLRSIDIYRTVEQRVFWGLGVLQCYRPPAIVDGYRIERRLNDVVYFGVANDAQVFSPAIMEADMEVSNAS